MQFDFDLQLFGGKGGGSSTTTYQSRPLTADEMRINKVYADYAEAASKTAYPLMNRASDMLLDKNTINPNYNNLYAQQAAGTAGNIDAAKNLANGQLSQSFIDNRNAQAKSYAENSVGGLLSNLASRGVIGSNQYDDGMKQISDSMAQAFTNSYTNDLNTSQGLLRNYQDYVDKPIAQANQAQQASYQLPLQLYGAATGQMQPASTIYQTAMNSQNGGSQTTSTSGGGGLFGGLLGAGTYALGQSWGRKW